LKLAVVDVRVGVQTAFDVVLKLLVQVLEVHNQH
jgi:hypothetical protein